MTTLELNRDNIASLGTGEPLSPPDPLLADFDASVGLVGSHVHADPYHTSLASGTPVHLVRESAGLAVSLLRRNKPGDAAIAEQILVAVCRLQDDRDGSTTAGVWPYYLEESLDEMAPPDHNWADFVGARLCHVLVEHAEQIGPETRRLVTAALERATHAICRRDVSADYTNIATMGGVVSVCAGEQLNRPEWIQFGTEKLRAVVASAEQHGSFPEYNSPTYTVVALEEAGRGLRLLRNVDARQSASRIADIAWRIISSHWHPGTQQWAGPFGRAYADLLPPSVADRLLRAAGIGETSAPPHEQTPNEDGGTLFTSCPPAMASRMRRLPTPTHVLRESCQRRHDGLEKIATTYFDEAFALGSVTHGHYWHQYRSLIAHIKTGSDVAVLRPRLLMDGRDFASAGNMQAQFETSVLSSLCFWTATGSFHPIFGASADGSFAMRDLELRIELIGDNVELRCVSPSLWQFRAGETRAFLCLAHAHFDDRQLVWSAARSDQGVAVVTKLVAQETSSIVSPAKVPTSVAFGLTLTNSDRPPCTVPRIENDLCRWSLGSELTVPVQRSGVPRAW